MHVLLIEDHPQLAAMLSQGLSEQGLGSAHAADLASARAHLAAHQPDAIVLDRLLPDGDGLTLCRALRQQGRDTPLLMLSVRDQVADRVAGLDAGADDYLSKPFAIEELVARLRALTRRGTATAGATLSHADLEMDLLQRTVHRAGTAIELRRKEFELLEYFVRHPYRLLSRATLGQHVWDMNFDPGSNVIDVSVSHLRSKVDKPFDVPLIHTVIGAGYIFGQRRDEP